MAEHWIIPRRAHCGGDVFALVHGDWGTVYGSVVKELSQAGVNNSQCTWIGGCRFCSPGIGGDYYCKYNYTHQLRHTNDKYHFMAFWWQGNETAHILAPSDTMKITIYGRWTNQYDYVNTYEPWPGSKCVPCLEFPVAGHLGAHVTEEVTLARYKKEQKPPRFFRDLWNSIMTYHQKGPGEQAPIEPTGNYHAFYGMLETNNILLNYSSIGWASPWGQCEDCPNGPGGSLMIPGTVAGEKILNYWQQIANPSYSYPVTFYRSGVYVGACPVVASSPFEYYDRNNPPWNSPP